MAAVALPRPLRFVVRNWPLKVGAVALATILYAGLVVSQNARLLAVRVPIEPIGQRTGAILLETLPDVTSIRYYAPADVASRLTSADFRASVDLRAVQPARGGAPQSVPVRLEATDPRVRVVDFEPRAVSVLLDMVAERTVPVVVERGEVPGGIAIGEPRVEPQEVTVRGASSLVARVARAVAPVSIDPNAINVDQDVDLVPVDDRGEEIAPLDLEPERARIFIAVETEAASRTLPVSVDVTGTVAPGYVVRSITTDPVAVTVLGDPAVVTALTSVPTVPVDVDGRSTTLDREVELALPEGVTVQDGEPTVAVAIRIVPQAESRSYPVGLTLANARADRIYALSTPQVIVVLGGPIPTFDALDVDLLTATIDVADLEPGEHTVEVSFVPPPGLRLVSISPTRVTVTVAVPATPSPAPSP